MPDLVQQITVLVPTLNRSDFLSRLLYYYKTLSFPGVILVGDSSGTPHLDHNRKICKVLDKDLDLHHYEFAGVNDSTCLNQLAHRVKTPYVAIVCDDDFKIPAGLERCAEFLHSHPDYVAAQGDAALFVVCNDAVHGQLERVSRYFLGSDEAETASDRLFSLLNHYFSPLHSLLRTHVLRSIFTHADGIEDRATRSELLPSCLVSIAGKVKQLKCLFLMRQVHNRRYIMADDFDWITSPGWSGTYQCFRNCLTEELMRQDRIEWKDAQEVVKHAFWSYLAHSISTAQHDHYATNGEGVYFKMRSIARQVPWLLRAGRQMRSFLPGEDNRLLLEALLRRSSPYHEDFMPIYRVITMPPPDLE